MLRPMIMLRRIAPSEEGDESLLPVKSIPGHFSAVLEATEADVDRVFGSEAQHERYFGIGNPLDMEATVCLDLDRFVERSNGIFGKSGTGKTFLTRVALCGLIRTGPTNTNVNDLYLLFAW